MRMLRPGVGGACADKFAEGYAGVSASEGPRKQGRVGRGPAVRLERRRHVDDLEKLAVLIQHSNRAMSAGSIPRTV